MSKRPKIIGGSAMTIANTIEDAVVPVQIEHVCDEIMPGTSGAQTYNYVLYHFEHEGTYVWARAYLNDIKTVSLFGPFKDRERRESAPGSIDPRIVAYFKRRYRAVDVFGAEGYRPLAP